MLCECKYNPEKDIMQVDDFGFIDLVDVMAKGEVPGNIGIDESMYNEIDDPSTIYGKPYDNFSALRMMDAIKSAGSNKPETE